VIVLKPFWNDVALFRFIRGGAISYHLFCMRVQIIKQIGLFPHRLDPTNKGRVTAGLLTVVRLIAGKSSKPKLDRDDRVRGAQGLERGERPRF